MKEFVDTGKKDTRSGFGAGLAELGRINPRVVALTADLKGSLKMDEFAAAYPERYFEVGIAEANMVGMAAGMAIAGYIPFIGTFANFASARVMDQVRQAVCYSETNVKIAASHAGITLGEDGATHQTLEDIGIMRMLPGMVVINPCDYNQTKAATIAAAAWNGPVYLRFGRPGVPNFTPADQPFEIGKAIKLNDGGDVSIFATGHLVWEAIQAAKQLEEQGVGVDLFDIATIKPLDKEAVIASARKTGRVVVAEEHLIAGGLGEVIAGVLATACPTPMRLVAIDDKFGQSGKPAELMAAYGLDAAHIVEAALSLR
ncbi:MAG: transketolase family protein [Bacteroidales bacterium]|nr:transketolase family protein [Bacteroidales bacterium]